MPMPDLTGLTRRPPPHPDAPPKAKPDEPSEWVPRVYIFRPDADAEEYGEHIPRSEVLPDDQHCVAVYFEG
jgi:hypothetical protein